MNAVEPIRICDLCEQPLEACCCTQQSTEITKLFWDEQNAIEGELDETRRQARHIGVMFTELTSGGVPDDNAEALTITWMEMGFASAQIEDGDDE